MSSHIKRAPLTVPPLALYTGEF